MRKVTLESLRRKARRTRDELAQIIRDTEHWNAHHRPVDCAPLDVGNERVALKLANDLVAALERGDTTGGHCVRLKDYMIAAGWGSKQP